MTSAPPSMAPLAAIPFSRLIAGEWEANSVSTSWMRTSVGEAPLKKRKSPIFEMTVRTQCLPDLCILTRVLREASW